VEDELPLKSVWLNASSSSSSSTYLSASAVHTLNLSQASLQCSNGQNSCVRAVGLTWVGHGQCNLVFTCPKLTGNPCGDYAVGLGGQNEEVCRTSDFVTKSISRGHRVTFELWKTVNASFEAKCYAWCAPDTRGRLRGQGDIKAQDQLLKALLVGNLTSSVEAPEASTNASSSEAISPFRVYELILVAGSGWEEEDCDEFNVCRMTYRFKWHHQGRGKIRLLAPEFSDGPCSHYGVTLDYGGPGGALPQVVEVCRPGHVYYAELNGSNEEFSVVFWHVRNTFASDFIAGKVLLWVTADGEAPTFTGANNTRVINKLLSLASHNYTVQLSSTGSLVQALSPVITYRLNVSSILECNKDDGCKYSVQLSQYHTLKCPLSLACPQLASSSASDPCSDHGLRLKINSSDTLDICHANRIYTKDLNWSTKATLELWMAKGAAAVSEMECFLWCTEDGSVPLHQRAGSAPTALEELTAAAKVNVPVVADPAVRPLCQTRVYHARISKNELFSLGTLSQSSGIIFYSLSFKWAAPYVTTAHVVVKGLGEESCTRFGAAALSPNNTEKSLCTNSIYSQRLEPSARGSQLSLSLWTLNQTSQDFTLDIYVWVKEQGQGLPGLASQTGVGIGLTVLQTLVMCLMIIFIPVDR
jgi:hypothetical protein